MTHAFDANQRYVQLRASVNGSQVNASAPDDARLAPAGYYMLFIVNSDPASPNYLAPSSLAKIVKLQ